MKSLLETLFDPGEMVCLSQSVYDCEVMPVEVATSLSAQFQYFSINPLKEWRSDKNCTAFRNFLIEFDTIALADQQALIRSKGVPFTSQVFSGGKSYHSIIALKDPVERHHYTRLARWLHAVLPLADKACQNPSRLSRMAGTVRDGTGKIQDLVELRGRVALDELTHWLAQSGVPEPIQVVYQTVDKFRGVKNLSGLTRRTREFLENGAAPGSRHHSLFAVTCNLHRCGFNEAEIVEKAKRVLDFDELPRFYRTVSEAVKVCLAEGQLKR
jgi:hypothetical protein